MALSELDKDYALFDWEASNGGASGEQTRTAHWALGNQGECIRFSYLVWNDMVDALLGLLESLGVGAAVSAGLRMREGDKALTAARFNGFRKNLEVIWRPGWPWALEEKPGWLSYPAASFLGRTDMVGAAQAGEDADVVYGWYLLELARKLNILIQVLRGDDVAAELACGAAVKTLRCAAALAAGAVCAGADRGSRTGEAGELLAAQAGCSAARRHSVSRGQLMIEAVRLARLLGVQDIFTRGSSAPTVSPCRDLPHEKRGGTADFAGVFGGEGVVGSSFGGFRGTFYGAADLCSGVCGSYMGAAGPEDRASVQSAGAEFAELRGGSEGGLEAGAGVAAPVFGEAAAGSRTAVESRMIAPSLDALRWLRVSQGSESGVRGTLERASPKSMPARLGVRFACFAGLTQAEAAAGGTENVSRTEGFAALGFDGNWLAPVRRGSDLYIRSVYRPQQDGSNLDIDRAVFYAPVKSGKSLYIRSQASMKGVL